jgi:ATP-binding cassette subfamily B protein/subfamily B ATP-binding cassette protein MsbA
VLLGRLWRDYLRPHRAMMALALALMVIEGSTLGALSWLLEPLFDKVFTGGRGDLVLWVGAGIFGLFLIRAVTSIASRTVMTTISLSTSSAMQVDLLAHVLRLDQGFFQTNPPGALIERLQGDTAAVQGTWQVFITGGGRDAIALVALFSVALSVDFYWTLSALIGVPLLIAPAIMAQRYIRKKTRQMRAQSSDRATHLDEIFHGITAIKLNGLEGYQTDRFARIVRKVRISQVKMAASNAAIPALVDVVTGLGFFIVLTLSGHQIISGERTVGEFMSFFTALSLAFQPLRRLGNISGSWQAAAASLERLYALFDTPPTVVSPAQPAPMPESPALQLKDVTLSYGETPVLRGLSFTAEAGQTTALVGPSGAGKSTVFGLLTRLIDPDSGMVTLGGTDLRALDLATLRARFASVSQDAALFDETIRENIVLGRPDVPAGQIARMIEAAHLRDFVAQLPAGLDTPAGPRGSALSGGQRQRVAIARALLRDAPILLLDEATSALDTTSEARVAEALDTLRKGHTTLVIAHRLSTVRKADKIVVIAEGRVVEEGRHDDLLARGGAYAELCRMQLVE